MDQLHQFVSKHHLAFGQRNVLADLELFQSFQLLSPGEPSNILGQERRSGSKIRAGCPPGGIQNRRVGPGES